MYMFFGDSHSRQFVGTSYGIFCHYVFSGATIKGLSNSQAVTGHAKLIRHGLSVDLTKSAFLMFGSVDFDFSLIRELCSGRIKDKDGFLAERVDIYSSFVTNLLDTVEKLDALYVIAPQISPLAGDNFFKQTPKHIGVPEDIVRNCALKNDISDRERAKTIVFFNDEISKKLNGERSRVLRIDKEMLDENFNIRKHFIPHDPHDHHASIDETKKLWGPIINECIKEHIIVG